MIALFLPYKAAVKSITMDNGMEFSKHEKVAEKLNAKTYFTHPYSSWEKGQIEYTNKIIRLPYMGKVLNTRIIESIDLLNSYKLKVDNYKSSKQNIEVPDNIYLLRIPPYTPKLNPCEQVWQYIKQRFKNKNFASIELLKQWLHKMVCDMDSHLIKSIVSNYHYTDSF